MKTLKFAGLLSSPRALSIWTTGEPYEVRFNAEGLDGNLVDGSQNATYVDSGPLNLPLTIFGETHQTGLSPFSKHWSVYYNQAASQYNRISNTPQDIAFDGSFTIEVYLFLTTTTNYKASTGEYLSRIISGVTNGSMELTLSGSTPTMNTICFGRVGEAPLLAFAQNIELRRWHHIAISRDSQGNLSLFFNGVKVRTVSGVTISFAGSALYAGGANITGKIGYWPGFLSNVRIVNGSVVYNPVADIINVPTAALPFIQNTTVLAFNKSNFHNYEYVPGQTETYNTPQMWPFGPFPVTGYIGGSAFFDGNGDYITTPDHSGLSPEAGDFCIDAFAFFSPTATECAVFSKVQNDFSTGFEWMLRLTGGNTVLFEAQLVTGQTLTLTSGAGSVIRNQWCHFAVCRQGNIISMFLNGYRVATASISSAIKKTTSSVQIGKDLQTGQNRAMNGYLSNCRFVKASSVYDPTMIRIAVPEGNLQAVPGTSLLLRFNGGAIVGQNTPVPVRTVGTIRSDTTVLRQKKASIYTGSSGSLPVPSGVFGVGVTVEFWFRFTKSSSGGAFIEVGRSYVNWQTSQVRIIVTPSTVRYLSANGLSSWYIDVSAGVSLPLNVWHHFKYSGAGNRCSVWINGNIAINNQPIGHRYASNDFILGQVSDTYIDEIKIY